MIWYEAYMENNALWQSDGESDEDYIARIEAHFDALKEADEDLSEASTAEFSAAAWH